MERMAATTKTLTRPEHGSDLDTLEAWWFEFLEALDELGIEPGDDFKVKTTVALEHHDDSIFEAPRSGSQRDRILKLAVERGHVGITSDEVSDELGIPIQSARPRVKELRDGKWLHETSKRRRSNADATVPVLIATQKGFNALGKAAPRRLKPLPRKAAA
jgi:hypothetical protein